MTHLTYVRTFTRSKVGLCDSDVEDLFPVCPTSVSVRKLCKLCHNELPFSGSIKWKSTTDGTAHIFMAVKY